ncbi:hypothetical protein ACIQBJ_33060 [Kitasatospora sp. NPDC088391]|uniref:hypothetical protein n=1 Tax=Kitasatospora sp. NPDC088391 TaxID=3364074 RepID=UPI0037F16887
MQDQPSQHTPPDGTPGADGRSAHRPGAHPDHSYPDYSYPGHPQSGQQQPPYPGHSQPGQPYPGQQQPGRPEPRSSAAKTWGVIAAVVSAAAGVASAIAAFSGGGGAGPSAGPAPAPQSTVAASTGGGTAATQPGATAAPPSAASAVSWSGKVRFGLAGIDLATTPPRVRDKDTIGDIWPSAQRIQGGMKIKGQVATWTGAGAPTAEDCRTLLTTQLRQEVEVSVGDRVCVVDGRSPLTLVNVTALHPDDGSYGELEADLTMWNLKLPK